MKRTNYCGDLRASHIGTKQTVCGWVNSYRNHGGVLFIDVRDRSGLVQIVVGPESPFFELASTLRNEYVVEVSGGVNETNLAAYCEAKPDVISSGALTHSVPSKDLSLKITQYLK